RRHGQDVIEGCAGGFQDRLDALQGVIGLLTNAFADLPRNRVSPGLAGHEHQIAETGGGGQLGIGRVEIYLNDFFLGHLVSCRAERSASRRARLTFSKPRYLCNLISLNQHRALSDPGITAFAFFWNQRLISRLTMARKLTIVNGDVAWWAQSSRWQA